MQVLSGLKLLGAWSRIGDNNIATLEKVVHGSPGCKMGTWSRILQPAPHGEDNTNTTPPSPWDSKEPGGMGHHSLTAPLYLQT